MKTPLIMPHGAKVKIARKMGQSKNTVSSYFTGKHKPKTDKQLRLFENACLDVIGFVPELFGDLPNISAVKEKS